MISTTTRLANSNPGIVPPWLQDSAVAAPTATRSASTATGVVDSGKRTADHGIAGDFHGLQDVDTSAQLVLAKREMTDIRGFFTKLGVQPSEGNDATQITIDPSFGNAAYNEQTDSVQIGVDPNSGVSYTKSPDVLAHEWSHRIIHHLAFTDPRKTSPEDLAIDESLADTFAAAYDQKNWTIGEGTGRAVRNMAHPEVDGNPGSVADYHRMFTPGSSKMVQVKTNRGTIEIPEPHALSALPSKAASLIGDAIGRDKMATIYMGAVRNYLKPGSEIEDLAGDVIQSATDLFGASSSELAATKQAWKAVGLLDIAHLPASS
jgi:Zn-dependent metalloprotease